MDGSKPAAKYRHEYKYIINEEGLRLIENRIRGLMQPDTHADDSKQYNIRSIYFDDLMNTCYYENENGTDPREKFRIRIYNHSPKTIHLELKRKERGKCLKQNCEISLEQFETIKNGGYIPISKDNPPLLNKLSANILTRRLAPKVIVEYDREPWVYKDGNVRVTFDRNIRSGKDMDAFFDDRLPTRDVMPPGNHILEVKWDEFLPDFIYRAASLKNIRQTNYSKYYICRKFSL